MEYKHYSKKDTKRFILPCAILNIIHGALAVSFFAFQFGLISTENLSETAHNIFMVYQLMIVITGIVVVVLSIKAKQKEKIVWYILATAIAGLDSLMLLFYGAVSIFAFINLAIGIVFVVNKNASGKEEKDLEF